MKKLICVLMAALMAIGSAAAAEQTEDDLLESMISAMALRDKVAQMMLPSFRLWKEVPEEEEEREKAKEDPGVKITELNDEIRGMLARDHFGGVLLFGENFADAEQTLRLVADMQTANQAGGGIPMLIAVDEEGGSVAPELRNDRRQQYGAGRFGRSGECTDHGGHPW